MPGVSWGLKEGRRRLGWRLPAPEVAQGWGTHREEVAECHMWEDLVSSVPGALALAVPPEVTQPLQQRPRGAEEQGVLLGDGVIQGGVVMVTVQPAAEKGRAASTGASSPAAGEASLPRDEQPPGAQPKEVRAVVQLARLPL